jgi:hypothetical protein
MTAAEKAAYFELLCAGNGFTPGINNNPFGICAGINK